MKHTSARVYCLLASVVIMTACGTSTPLQPSTASSAGTATNTTTFSSTVPLPVAPADAAQLAFAAQPFTLTVSNAVSTSPDAPTYTFEVATDSGFTNIIFTKSGVAQGGNGQTSLVIDKLAASSKFFWRARPVTKGEPGPAAKARSFNIGAQVILQTPVPATPGQNGIANGGATLTVNNVQRSGPAGPISYKFDLSDSSSFAKILFTSTVPEQGGAGGQTNVTPNVNLANNGTYFWRVQASDPANFVTTAFSSVFSFKFVAFDMSQAIIKSSPSDLASWPVTATITEVQMRPDAMIVDFDRRDGPNAWPETVPVGFEGGLQYTLGMCLNIGGQWYCSGVVQFWRGRELEAAASPSSIPVTWFYDPARWGPMSGFLPNCGDQVGFFVGQGDLRGRGTSDGNSIRERSNVQLVDFCGGFEASGKRRTKLF